MGVESWCGRSGGEVDEDTRGGLASEELGRAER